MSGILALINWNKTSGQVSHKWSDVNDTDQMGSPGQTVNLWARLYGSPQVSGSSIFKAGVCHPRKVKCVIKCLIHQNWTYQRTNELTNKRAYFANSALCTALLVTPYTGVLSVWADCSLWLAEGKPHKSQGRKESKEMPSLSAQVQVSLQQSGQLWQDWR